VTDTRRKFSFNDYLSLRLIAMVLALSIICAITASLDFERQTALVVLIVGVMKVLDGVSDVHFGMWQRHEHFDGIAYAQMLNGALSVIILAALVVMTHSIVWAAVGAACGSAVSLGYVLLRHLWYKKEFGFEEKHGIEQIRQPTQKAARLWQLTMLTLPLAFATGITALQASVPRYMLKGFCDTRTVGLYAVASSLLVLISLVTQAMGEAILPRTAALYQSGQLRRFIKLAAMNTATQVSVCMICTGVFYMFGEKLISLLFTPEYVTVVPMLIIMSAGFALMHLGAFGISVLYAGRKFKTQAILIGFTLLVQLPVAWILIERYGIWGAAWADLVRYAVFMLAVNAHAIWAVQTYQNSEFKSYAS